MQEVEKKKLKKIDDKNQLSSKWYYKRVLDFSKFVPLSRTWIIRAIYNFCRMKS